MTAAATRPSSSGFRAASSLESAPPKATRSRAFTVPVSPGRSRFPAILTSPDTLPPSAPDPGSVPFSVEAGFAALLDSGGRSGSKAEKSGTSKRTRPSRALPSRVPVTREGGEASVVTLQLEPREVDPFSANGRLASGRRDPPAGRGDERVPEARRRLERAGTGPLGREVARHLAVEVGEVRGKDERARGDRSNRSSVASASKPPRAGATAFAVSRPSAVASRASTVAPRARVRVHVGRGGAHGSGCRGRAGRSRGTSPPEGAGVRPPPCRR